MYVVYCRKLTPQGISQFTWVGNDYKTIFRPVLYNSWWFSVECKNKEIFIFQIRFLSNHFITFIDINVNYFIQNRTVLWKHFKTLVYKSTKDCIVYCSFYFIRDYKICRLQWHNLLFSPLLQISLYITEIYFSNN